VNNKKIKVISSMAVAGLLTLNVFSANALIAQAKEVDDTVNATRPLGIYRSLISGENKAVAPVVVQKDKTTFTDDYVTVNELINSDKISTITAFNGTNINSVSRKEMVKTGDTITISGGETVTVVVYGDVNKDGLVDGDDASEILKYDVGGRTFDSIEKLAADVKNAGNNKGVVDGDDASHILKYDVGMEKAIEVEPKAEVDNYEFTLEVNGNNIINNITETKSNIVIKLAQRETEVTGLTLVAEDSNGIKSNVINVPNINPYTSQIIVENQNITKAASGQTLNNNPVSILADGNITIYLKNVNDEIVGTAKVNKNTIAPEATNVSTVRTTSRKATFSLEAFGESDITKIYYLVDTNMSSTTTVEDIMKTGNIINVTGNKITNYEIANNLQEKLPATILYVLENSNGSISPIPGVTTPLKAIISTDNAEKEKAIEEITVPNLEKGETEFSWDLGTGKNAIVNLLKDGKVISANNEVIGVNDKGVFDVERLITEEGTYKITVKVTGANNGTTADSEIVTSEEITVSKLKEVTNLKLEITDKANSKAKLTWTNPNKVEDFKECSIQLYKLEKDQQEKEVIETEVWMSPETVVNNEKAEIEIDIEDLNTVYFAKVKLIADNDTQKALISSNETKSNEVFIVDTVLMAPTDAKKTTNDSITLNVNPLEIVGRMVSNKIEVYTVNETDGTDVKYVKTSKTVQLNKEDKTVVIEGLENNKKYAFRLVTIVEGTEEVKSDFSATIRTYATMPTMVNLTVTKDYEKALEANSKKVAVNGNNIAINGTEYVYTGEDFKGTNLVRNSAIVAALEEGDNVTIQENTVTLTLNDNESKREFDTVKGMDQITLNVTSNEFAKTLSGKVKSISLSGNGAIYDVSRITSTNNIELNTGVEVVKSNKKYTLNSNAANVIINKVVVSTQQQTEIIAVATGLNVTANTVINTLTFSNINGVIDNAIITFVGLANNTSVQAGTININSNVAEKTITLRSNTANKVNISANVNVVAKAGTVDLAENTLNGNKNIKITKSANAKVSAIFFAEVKAPTNLKDTPIDSTDDELKVLLNMKNGDVPKEDEELSEKEKETLQSVKEYLALFGLEGKGAEVTNNAKDNKTTISFEKTTKDIDTTIGNIH